MARPLLAASWLLQFAINATLLFLLPGEETIPYHVIWATFALVYGLETWSKRVTWGVFWSVTVVTAVAFVHAAELGVIGWEECTEIPLMGVLLALLVWHVDRQRASQASLAQLREQERQHAHERDLVARFGSHEIRTRLTIARGFADLVGSTSSDATTRSDVHVITQELDRASALATRVLTLMRVQAPSPPSATSLVDIDELIDELVHRWSTTVSRRLHGWSNVGLAAGDGERLQAALDCLVENAVTYTDGRARIEVRALLGRDTLEISVRDEGCGMPPDDHDRVVRLFETGSNAGPRAGSGLGLSIARAIAATHGGTLRVASELGVGTTMTLVLPHRVPGVIAPLAAPEDASDPERVPAPLNDLPQRDALL